MTEVPIRARARHEAAHAVVSIRLGLPLAFTSIRPGDAPPIEDPALAHATTLGYTTLDDGVGRAWLDALPDPIAAENLRRLAVQHGAGVIAEERRALAPPLGAADDIRQMSCVAAALGIEPEARRAWCDDCCDEAAQILLDDDGAGWDRVTDALVQKGRLSGDEVRALLEEVGR